MVIICCQTCPYFISKRWFCQDRCHFWILISSRIFSLILFLFCINITCDIEEEINLNKTTTLEAKRWLKDVISVLISKKKTYYVTVNGTYGNWRVHRSSFYCLIWTSLIWLIIFLTLYWVYTSLIDFIFEFTMVCYPVLSIWSALVSKAVFKWNSVSATEMNNMVIFQTHTREPESLRKVKKGQESLREVKWG